MYTWCIMWRYLSGRNKLLNWFPHLGQCNFLGFLHLRAVKMIAGPAWVQIEIQERGYRPSPKKVSLLGSKLENFATERELWARERGDYVDKNEQENSLNDKKVGIGTWQSTTKASSQNFGPTKQWSINPWKATFSLLRTYKYCPQNIGMKINLKLVSGFW